VLFFLATGDESDNAGEEDTEQPFTTDVHSQETSYHELSDVLEKVNYRFRSAI